MMEDGWLMAFHDLFRYEIPSLGGSEVSSDAHVALGSKGSIYPGTQTEPHCRGTGRMRRGNTSTAYA